MTQTMIFGLAADTMTWGERFSTAGIVTLQGMVTIFLVLAILWGSIEVMHRVIAGKPKKTTKKVVEEAPASVAEQIPAPKTFGTPDESEVVAAIVAAISAMREEQGQTGGFRVVSFKRAGSQSAKNKFN